jgi:uracil-DNA glycosylase
LGPQFRLTRHRGEPQRTDFAPWLLATLHPSSLLRLPDRAAREAAIRSFVDDMRLVARQLEHERRSA